MSTINKSSIFSHRQNPPKEMTIQKHNKFVSSPIYYFDDIQCKHLMFLITQKAKKNYLIKYDLDKQVISRRQIPVNDNVVVYGYCNQNLAIIYFICKQAFCLVFKIKSEQFSHLYEYPEQALRPINTQMVHVAAPNDVMHVISMGNQYTLDHKDLDSENCMQSNVMPFKVLLKNIPIDINGHGKFIFVSISNQLIYFPAESNYCLVLDLTDVQIPEDDRFYCNDKYGFIKLLRSNMDAQPISGWRISDIPPPCLIPRLTEFDVFIGWNQFLFFFHHGDDKLYCIDLMAENDESEWELINFYGPQKMKSIGNTVNIEENTDENIMDFAIKDRRDIVHLMKLQNNHIHISVDLYDLMPKRMRERLESNHKENKKVVIDYCR